MEPNPPTDDDPIAQVVAEGPRRSRRRLPWLVAAGVGALVIVGVVVAVLATRDQGGYDDQTRDDFLAACTADGGDPVRPTCECIYDEMVATVPYDRFEEVDEQLTQQSGDLTLPDDVSAIVDGCVAAAAPKAS